MKKILPYNYYHRHPGMEQSLNVPKDHVIIDKVEYEEVLFYLVTNGITVEDIKRGIQIKKPDVNHPHEG